MTNWYLLIREGGDIAVVEQPDTWSSHETWDRVWRFDTRTQALNQLTQELDNMGFIEHDDIPGLDA